MHGTEGHLIADELEGVSVIAGPNLCDRSKPELREQTFKNPAALSSNGAILALTTDHPVSPLNYLPLCAAMAKKEGLSPSAALEALTVNPARILGIEERVGTLEKGKDADVLLIRGDVLSLEHTVEAVFIDGVRVK